MSLLRYISLSHSSPSHLYIGSIPSFLDAILNIAESDTSTTLLHQDNWLAEMRRTRNKTIHFFGDDTWIKLFPDLFGRSEGTTSFYVTVSVSDMWDWIMVHEIEFFHI